MYVDSHAHIDGEEFAADLDDVLARARAAGVRAILTVGTGNPHSGTLERAVALAARYPDVYASAGVHPHDARHFDEEAAQRLEEILNAGSPVVALGEIGLDYHYDNSPREAQREVFARQLRMARAMRLPVIIHSREADEDTIKILRAEWPGAERSGVLHCFGGGWEMAQAALELGFMISFAGTVTFKKAEAIREVARQVPLDRLLIETDCPYLAPVPVRGRRNEPAYVVHVAKCLADLRGMTVEDVGRVTARNFARLFAVPFDLAA